MHEKRRRKQLVTDYKQRRPEAGVYRLVNAATGKAFLGSTPNLASVQSKLEFAQKTGSAGTLGYQLKDEVERYGADAFSLEILEVLEVRPEMTPSDVQADLTTLEALWREKLDPASLY